MAEAVDVAALRKLAAAAAPGPWFAQIDTHTSRVAAGRDIECGDRACDGDDAEFIDAPRAAVLLLLDEVERLRAVIREAVALIEQASGDIDHEMSADLVSPVRVLRSGIDP